MIVTGGYSIRYNDIYYYIHIYENETPAYTGFKIIDQLHKMGSIYKEIIGNACKIADFADNNSIITQHKYIGFIEELTNWGKYGFTKFNNISELEHIVGNENWIYILDIDEDKFIVYKMLNYIPIDKYDFHLKNIPINWIEYVTLTLEERDEERFKLRGEIDHIRDECDCDMIDYSIMNDRVDILRVESRYADSIDDAFELAIDYYIKNMSSYEILEYLIIYRGANVSEDHLLKLANCGDMKMVKFIVERCYIKITSELINNIKEEHCWRKTADNMEIKEYLMQNISQSPVYLFKNINSKCDSSKITDDQFNLIVKILNLPDNTNKTNLCELLKNLFQDKKNIALPKCHEKYSIVGDDIEDIHPMYFHTYISNNKLYCEDIRNIIKFKGIAPYTNIKIDDIDKIEKDYTALITIINDTRNEDEEIRETITSTIRKAMDKVFDELRYPINKELYINSDYEMINNFLNKLEEENILSLSDINELKKINVLESLKLALANLLILKLENDTTFVTLENGNKISSFRIMLEEVYNSIFSIY